MKTVYKHSKLFQGILVALILFFVILAYNFNEYYYIAIIPIVVFMFLLSKKSKEYKHNIFIENALDNWGQKSKKKYKNEIYEAFYKKDSNNNDKQFNVDSQTWFDLNMEEIFKTIDYTFTIPGQQFLYKLLRNISLDKQQLEKRKKSVNYIIENKTFKKQLHKCMIEIGSKGGEKCVDFLYNPTEINKKEYKKLIAGRIIALISILICILNFGIGIFIFMGVFVYNFKNYYYTKNIIEDSIKSIKYLSKIFKHSNTIVGLEFEKLSINKERFSEIITRGNYLKKKLDEIIFFNDSKNSILLEFKMFLEVFNALFLIEPIKYYKTIKYIKENMEDLKEIYSVIGELDSLLSIAELRESTDYYCEPEFNDKKLTVKNAFYPLLSNPVKNSITISDKNGILITGSNMSGKSTFLRTVSVNTLFAQTIVTVFAESYEGNIYQLYTSISVVDDVIKSDSHYLAEVKSVKRMIDNLSENITTLCFIDEIFAGTNRIDRTAAASQILAYLIKHNAIVFVTTHDLEIADKVKSYDNYHFKEDVEDKDIIFDYTIRKGISKTSNAIEVLRYAGYKDEIYIESKKLAEELRIV